MIVAMRRPGRSSAKARSTSPSQQATAGGYTFTAQAFERRRDPNKMTVAATIEVTKGSERVATLRPARHVYLPRQEPGDEVAIAGGPTRDIWVNLAGLTPTGVASIHVFVDPLISWLWIGGLILLLGSIIAAWPPPRGVRSQAPARPGARPRLMGVAVLVAAVALAVVVAVAWPLLHERHQAESSAEDQAGRALQDEIDRSLRAIREIEFDHRAAT